MLGGQYRTPPYGATMVPKKLLTVQKQRRIHNRQQTKAKKPMLTKGPRYAFAFSTMSPHWARITGTDLVL